MIDTHAMRLFQPIIITSQLFSLKIHQNKRDTKILMNLYTKSVNTKDLPQTFPILKKLLPTILVAKCYNDDQLPFTKEVKNTEIGHLFEHILLEYLCLLKLNNGCKKATFRGETNWNWKRDLWGTFHIYVNAGSKDEQIFSQALQKSIELLHKIMQLPNQTPLYNISATEPLPNPIASEPFPHAEYKQI